MRRTSFMAPTILSKSATAKKSPATKTPRTQRTASPRRHEEHKEDQEFLRVLCVLVATLLLRVLRVLVAELWAVLASRHAGCTPRRQPRARLHHRHAARRHGVAQAARRRDYRAVHRDAGPARRAARRARRGEPVRRLQRIFDRSRAPAP